MTRGRKWRGSSICASLWPNRVSNTPVAKYPALALEERRAVDVGHAYRTPSSAKSFTGFIVRSRASLIYFPAEAISLGCQ